MSRCYDNIIEVVRFMVNLLSNRLSVMAAFLYGNFLGAVMKKSELIKVYIDYQDGKTVCICKRSNKGCDKHCQKDIVERDKFRGWQGVMNNRYGL